MYGDWYYYAPDGGKGEWSFRLYKHDTDSQVITETPADLHRVEESLLECRNALSLNVSQPSVFLNEDRRTGKVVNPSLYEKAGVYVLFYNDGRIARIGQTERSFSKRVKEYDVKDVQPDTYYWVFRWVALIPVEEQHRFIITPLEKYLIGRLHPPENTKDRVDP